MKKLLHVVLTVFLAASLLPSAVHAEEDEEAVFAPREYQTYYGVIPSIWDDAWHMTGYQFEEYIKMDGVKDPVYDYGLILETDHLIDGEDTGAHAKIYLLRDYDLRVFIEVTDSEMVTPSEEEQFTEPKGIDAFDSIEILLDPEEEFRGRWLPNPETGEYEQIVDQGSIARLYRFDWTGFGYSWWTDYSHSLEYDTEGSDGKYFTNSDLYGSGGPLMGTCRPTDENDENSCVFVQKTETGYNIEVSLFLTKTDETAVYGLEVILNDAYENGDKVSSYSTNASLNKDNVLDYTKWNGVQMTNQSLLITNRDVMALYDPNLQKEDTGGADTEKSVDSAGLTADTSGKVTSAKSADASGENKDGIPTGAVAAFVISGVLIVIVIVVLVIRYSSKSNGQNSGDSASGAT